MLVDPVTPRAERNVEPVAETAGAPCVRLRDVTHDYGGWTRALEIKALDVGAGELVAVVGPRGCGKSTLLALVAGQMAPSRGFVEVAGRPVEASSRGRLTLQPWVSVRGSIELGPRLRAALAVAGLGGLTRPTRLRPGSDSRARLAHALAPRRRPVLLDDPFGTADALARERLQDQLHRLWRATRPTVLFATDSLEEAAYVGSRVVLLGPRPGHVIFDAPAPFGAGPRPRGARTAPEFAGFRERLAHELAVAIAEDSH